jgi:hypothetical protein
MTSIVVNDGHEGEMFLAYVEQCLVATLGAVISW